MRCPLILGRRLRAGDLKLDNARSGSAGPRDWDARFARSFQVAQDSFSGVFQSSLPGLAVGREAVKGRHMSDPHLILGVPLDDHRELLDCHGWNYSCSPASSVFRYRGGVELAPGGRWRR